MSNSTCTTNGVKAVSPPSSKQDNNNNNSNSNSSGLSYKALLFMSLLALQFGIQPIVTKQFTSPKIIKSSVIFMQEVVKLLIAFGGISLSGVAWGEVLKGWTITSWLRLSLLPATIYLIQNMCSLLAYQNLDAITYNVLNQTKTLSAALCCYLLLGKKQSMMQMMALILLLVAALVMEGILPLDIRKVVLLPTIWMEKILSYGNGVGDNGDATTATTTTTTAARRVSHGVLPIMIASFLSGLAGAITQKSLQVGNRHALLFTMELCIASLLLLLLSFLRSQDGEQIKQRGFFDEWTVLTFIPILTNSAGGILVGLVIKYAGTVQKGFALIFGILISGILQSLVDEDKSLSLEDVVGGVLAGISLWMHATNPYVASSSSISKTVVGLESGDSKTVDRSASKAKSVVGKKGGGGGRRSKKED